MVLNLKKMEILYVFKDVALLSLYDKLGNLLITVKYYA